MPQILGIGTLLFLRVKVGRLSFGLALGNDRMSVNASVFRFKDLLNTSVSRIFVSYIRIEDQ